MDLQITQDKYCRFGGLKRYLIENEIDVSDSQQLTGLNIIKTDFTEEYSYLIDEELKELKQQGSFWTEFDYEKKHVDDNDFTFKIPQEKFNSTYYSHYAVIEDWFKKSEEIKILLRNNKCSTSSKYELFSNQIETDCTEYFQLVRKVCGIENTCITKKYFLYDISDQLHHPVLLTTSPAGVELCIPFYGFYSFFKKEELFLLTEFVSYISQNFKQLLEDIERKHNSYMEEKYGEEYLKIKKHEMQYELKKQMEEQFIKKFNLAVKEISPDISCESQSFENKIQFRLYKEKQSITYNFTFEELKILLQNDCESLKSELKLTIR